MTVDPLDSLTVMRELRQLRNQVEVKWESLTDPGEVSDFLARTEEITVVSERIGELSPGDAHFLDLRDVALARAVAAKTLGRLTGMESALALAAVLSLSASSRGRVASFRHLLEGGAGCGVGPDFSVIGESVLPGEESEGTGAPSWEVQIGILARGPFSR